MMDLCFENFKNLIQKKKIENVVITSPVESLPYPILLGMNLKEKLTDKKRYKEKINHIKNSNVNYFTYKKFIKYGKKYISDVEESYEANRPVAIVHTGGTTGIPKGVLLSNDNLNELTNQIKNSDLQFLRHYLLLGVMPEFVGYGLSVGLHTSLVCGMQTMMIAKYEPEKIPELILKYKPNCMAGSPAHWEIISESPLINDPNVDLSFFKGPIEGGDTLNLKVERKVNEILKNHGCQYKLIKGYGMTEKCSAVTASFKNELNELGSVGVPFAKTNIAIYDNENQKDLSYKEIGEICVNAPDVMLGYYNNPAETDKVIRTHADGKKWLHSGDLGYIDEKGLLYVVGRIKDIIIRYDGIKIYPYNVESILLKNPYVESIAVVGISDPKHLNGEIPIAFPVFKEDSEEKTALSNLMEYAKHQVADYAIPVEYHIMKSLPITQVGKVDKKKLKEIIKI